VRSTSRLELLSHGHAATLLAFERENRAYFAASIPDRGDDFFAEFEARFERWLEWQAAGTDYFHVLATEGGAIEGRVNLVEVADGWAELGYRIAEKCSGQGLATTAVREVLVMAGESYGLTRVRAKVTLDNPASRTVLQRNGFVATGDVTINGKPATSFIREL
jgi:ribosomal-protein-alanine N-acetyltransferase